MSAYTALTESQRLMVTDDGENWSPVAIWIVVVDPVPVHAEVVVTVDRVADADGLGVGFLPAGVAGVAGADDAVPTVAVLPVSDGFEVGVGLAVA